MVFTKLVTDGCLVSGVCNQLVSKPSVTSQNEESYPTSGSHQGNKAVAIFAFGELLLWPNQRCSLFLKTFSTTSKNTSLFQQFLGIFLKKCPSIYLLTSFAPSDVIM